MATHDRGAELIGLEIAGTGTRHQLAAREVLLRPELRDIRRGVRVLIWQTAHLYPAEVIDGAVRGSWSPRYEGDVVMNWQKRDFPTLAAQVTVPVRFSLADHEAFWEAGAEGLADVASMFTASPRVIVNEQRDSGHNLSLGHSAAAYHLGVLAFAEECAVVKHAEHDLDSEAS